MNTAIVLLACGSFNPITRMHLGMFQLAKNYFERNKVKFLKGKILRKEISYKFANLFFFILHNSQKQALFHLYTIIILLKKEN